MKTLYTVIAFFLIGMFPIHSYETVSNHIGDMEGHESGNNRTCNVDSYDSDRWTDERVREYEDSLVNALFPMPAIVETPRGSMSTGSPEASGPAAEGVVTGYAHIPDSRKIDTSCIVGYIPVTSGVSKTGARTFEIPMEVYPGINGMQPKIAISYNSQYPNSSMGPGWHISGLSAITRGVKTIYYDGSTSSVSMTPADAFYLDGMRLIKTGGSSSPYTYRSEYGQIVARQYFTGSVTRYFEVFYPDGEMAIFGFKDNTAGHVIYPLTELTDLHDNTIRYSYEKYDGIESYDIKRITYNNTASIDFTYVERDVMVPRYVAGIKISNQYMLDAITSRSGNIILDRYLFTYTGNGTTPLLTRISRENGKGGRFNPVELYYGTGQSREGWTSRSTELPRSYVIDGKGNLRVLRGRFDYINKTDGLISLPVKPTYWKHHNDAGTFKHSEDRFDNYYKGDEDIFIYPDLMYSQSDTMSVLKTEVGFVDIMCADLLGQQEEFIIKVNNTVVNGLDRVTFTTYQFLSGSGLRKRHTRTFNFSTVYTDKRGDKSIQPKFYFPGDFNGDGKMEILAMSTHEPFGDTGKPTVCYIFDLEAGRVLYQGSFLKFKREFYGYRYLDPPTAENRSDKLMALDMDGDGKTDLVHINESGTDVYTFDISGSTFTPREVGWYSALRTSELHDRRILAGDFNGDGCADLFATQPFDDTVYPNYCTTYLSMGNGRFDRYGKIIDTPPSDGTTFLAHDINGDGLTDVMMCTQDSLTAYLGQNGYISDAEGFSYKLPSRYGMPVPVAVNTRNCFPQIMCLNTDKVFKLTWNTDERIETLLSGLAGSLGTVEKTSYTRTDKFDEVTLFQVYKTGRDAVFPYVNLMEPIPVVTATESFLSGKSLGRESYTYTNAVMHRQGLGFTGFQKIQKTDARGKTTVSEYEPYRYGLPRSVATPESETTFAYSVKTAADRTVIFNLDSKKEKDLLRGTDVTASYTYDTYGFPLTETMVYSDGRKITSANGYSHFASVGKGYILGLKKNVSTKYSKSGCSDTYDGYSVTAFSKGLPLSEISLIDGKRVSKKIYAYDSRGLRISEAFTPYSSTDSLTKVYGYNTDGLLTSETDELGLKTEYSYGPDGKVTAKTDIRGGVTTYTYDAAGRQASATRPDSTVARTNYKWALESENTVFSVVRRETGKPRTEEVFDGLGRSVWKSETRFHGYPAYVWRKHDEYGNVTFESAPYLMLGGTSYGSSYTYDMYDRPVKCTGPDGEEKTWSYSGNTVTVKENGIQTTRTYDSTGNLVKITDPSGSIVYDLDAAGNPRTITAPGNVKTTFTYDGFRRRKTMTDPSKGTISLNYDDSGNVSEEIDANGDTISYAYDKYGRITDRVTPELSTKYTYNPYGALKSVRSTNGTSLSVTYDDFGRILKTYDSAASRYHYRKEYTYSSGNVKSVTYAVSAGSSSYRTLGKETFTYSNGHLKEILLNDTKTIYRLDGETSYGQTSIVTTGGIKRTYLYSGPVYETGRVAKKDDEVLLDLSTKFDAATSNLLSRKDNKFNLSETFSYDGLNRMAAYGGNTASYDAKGNILSRSEIGSFSYGHSSKPYALTEVSTSSDIVPASVQEITYTSFSRPARIEENGYTAEFTYNADYDRVNMVIDPKTHGVKKSIKYLGGNFESVYLSTSTSAAEERLYLGGGYYDAPAVYVRKNNKWTLYFILRDYLGSIVALADEEGNVVQRLSYDAWGNLRDPQTLKAYKAGEEPVLMLGRGFTGHEHIPQFGLVNMNARLYDPLLGRFLSPDPYVQSECGPQGFNRYSYCLNNPLRYIDEDGEIPLLLVGALFGGCANLVTKVCSGQIHNAGDAFAAFGIGAVAGLVGTATGGWAFGAAGGGFLAGAAGAGLGAATDKYLQSLGNHAYFGDPIISAKDLLVDAAVSAVIGGTVNGYVAAEEGKNFWTGEKIAAGRGTFSLNNSPKQVYTTSDVQTSTPGLQETSPKIREIADRISKGKPLKLKDYQEVNYSIEENGLKLDFRIETHNRVEKVFKNLNIDRATEIRHMNVQLYEWNKSIGDYIDIPVPGYGDTNYHLFLNFKK